MRNFSDVWTLSNEYATKHKALVARTIASPKFIIFCLMHTSEIITINGQEMGVPLSCGEDLWQGLFEMNFLKDDNHD